jgi:hypothetical protein
MTPRDVRMLVSLSCEEASRLASEALDRDLSWSERWTLRFHGFMCRSCRRLMQQLATMRALLSNMPQASQQQLRVNLPRLSPDRKQQIKQLLRDAKQSEQG